MSTPCITKHHLHGYDEFCRFVDDLPGEGGAPIYFLFCGSTDDNGVNWCPYCVTAEPVVEAGLKLAPAGSVFVHVTVGEREYWKDPKCPFRTDRRTKLFWVPTLLRWQSELRIDSRHVSDATQVDALFSHK